MKNKETTLIYVKKSLNNSLVLTSPEPKEGYSPLYVTNYPCTQEEARLNYLKQQDGK
jgi:hypothetical protein